jgi:hypothetical protein
MSAELTRVVPKLCQMISALRFRRSSNTWVELWGFEPQILDHGTKGSSPGADLRIFVAVFQYLTALYGLDCAGPVPVDLVNQGAAPRLPVARALPYRAELPTARAAFPWR